MTDTETTAGVPERELERARREPLSSPRSAPPPPT
jgi:hypothetical protein